MYDGWEEKARKQFSNQELLAMLDSKQIHEVQCSKIGKDRLVILNSGARKHHRAKSAVNIRNTREPKKDLANALQVERLGTSQT